MRFPEIFSGYRLLKFRPLRHPRLSPPATGSVRRRCPRLRRSSSNLLISLYIQKEHPCGCSFCIWRSRRDLNRLCRPLAVPRNFLRLSPFKISTAATSPPLSSCHRQRSPAMPAPPALEFKSSYIPLYTKRTPLRVLFLYMAQ